MKKTRSEKSRDTVPLSGLKSVGQSFAAAAHAFKIFRGDVWNRTQNVAVASLRHTKPPSPQGTVGKLLVCKSLPHPLSLPSPTSV
jgi:hypothetical protein